MRLMFNKKILFSISFLSFSLLVIALILRSILIPTPDIHLLTSEELVEIQKEYAINYPVGTGIFYAGLFLMSLAIILWIGKFLKSKNNHE